MFNRAKILMNSWTGHPYICNQIDDDNWNQKYFQLIKFCGHKLHEIRKIWPCFIEKILSLPPLSTNMSNSFDYDLASSSNSITYLVGWYFEKCSSQINAAFSIIFNSNNTAFLSNHLSVCWFCGSFLEDVQSIYFCAKFSFLGLYALITRHFDNMVAKRSTKYNHIISCIT